MKKNTVSSSDAIKHNTHQLLTENLDVTSKESFEMASHGIDCIIEKVGDIYRQVSINQRVPSYALQACKSDILFCTEMR